jgi:hypothetical protein
MIIDNKNERYSYYMYWFTHIFSVKSTERPKFEIKVEPWSNLKKKFNSLGMISYTLSILLFALKPMVKKLLSIEIVIFHICTLGSIIRKISVTGSCLEQTWERPLIGFKTVCSPVALMVLEKIFKDLAVFFMVFHFLLFGKYSEPCKQILKRPTQGTFLQTICFLDIIVSEKKIFKELLTRTRNA